MNATNHNTRLLAANQNDGSRAHRDAPNRLAHPNVDANERHPVIFQLESLASEPSTLPPDVALAVGVLRQAARDLHTFHSAKRGIERQLYLDAYSWVRAEDYSWPYSFANVCAALRVPSASMRAEILAEAPLGWSAYWGKVISRRIRSLRASFADSFRPAQAA